MENIDSVVAVLSDATDISTGCDRCSDSIPSTGMKQMSVVNYTAPYRKNAAQRSIVLCGECRKDFNDAIAEFMRF